MPCPFYFSDSVPSGNLVNEQDLKDVAEKHAAYLKPLPTGITRSGFLGRPGFPVRAGGTSRWNNSSKTVA